MKTKLGITVTRPRGALVVFAFAFASLMAPASVSAADAPNTCAGATSARAQNTWLSETISSSTDVDWYRFTTSSSGYSLVTLGNLPADYDLSLYGGTCSTLLATSHRSNREYDEIYRSLSAGTYFVKVQRYAPFTSSMATSPYALRFKRLAEGVQVLSYTGWTDSAGYRHLVGELLNNTPDRRRWIQIDATLYNSSNVAIGSALGYPDFQFLMPRTRSPFEIAFRIPAGYHHSRLAIGRSSVTAAIPVGNLAVTPGAAYSGSIKNNNTSAVMLSRAHATAYDSYGAVRDVRFAFTAYTPAIGASPSTIASGATKSFNAGAPRFAANRIVYQPEATRTGCVTGSRYTGTAIEDFKPATTASPTIARSTASSRIALTFDMGGRMVPAVKIMNFLVANRVCATIMPTGIMSQTTEGKQALAIIEAHPELFELGNHTMHHCNLRDGGGGSPTGAYCTSSRPSAAFIQKELKDAEAIIEAATGRQANPYWRAPYGAYDAAVLSAAAAAGYTKHFRWDIDTIDWRPVSDGGPTARSMALKVVNNAKSGSVVLMHLGGYETLDALPAMVDGLRSRGFVTTTLSDMLR